MPGKFLRWITNITGWSEKNDFVRQKKTRNLNQLVLQKEELDESQLEAENAKNEELAKMVRRGEGVGFPSDTTAFDPNSNFRAKWDTTIMMFLLYYSFITPYEIAFLNLAFPDPLAVVNYLIDLFFFVDLLINFNTGYYKHSTGMWVTTQRKIVYQYVTTWFMHMAAAAKAMASKASAAMPKGLAARAKAKAVARAASTSLI